MSVEQLEQQVQALSAAERQRFAEWFDDHRHEIIPPDEILTAQEQEIRRRLDEMEANPALRENFSASDLDALCDSIAHAHAQTTSARPG